MEQETIEGFSIPKRELTEEEATRELTFDRIQDFHHQAGEDFTDTVSNINHQIFAGYLMYKFPERSLEILDVVNEKHSDINDFKEFFEQDGDFEDRDYYENLCEFANLTQGLKTRLNQVLIQVAERYKD